MKSFVTAAFLIAGISTAQADLITFADWVDTDAQSADYTLTIDDESAAGKFTFNASVDAGYMGSMLAIGFSTTNTFNYTADNLGLTPAAFTPSFDSLVCAPVQGCNFNGTGLTAFDVIVRFAAQGNGVSSITFAIDQLPGMTLDDFLIVGIRAQDTGRIGDRPGSDKVYAVRPPVSVPEPATLALLAVGLLPLVRVRRRRA